MKGVFAVKGDGKDSWHTGKRRKGACDKAHFPGCAQKNDICFIYTVEISLEPRDERRILKRGLPTVCEAEAREIREVATGSIPLDKPIIVVGMGPGGLLRRIRWRSTATSQ